MDSCEVKFSKLTHSVATPKLSSWGKDPFSSAKTYLLERPRSQHVWALWMLESATRALIETFFIATVWVNSPNFTSQLSILVEVFDCTQRNYVKAVLWCEMPSRDNFGAKWGDNFTCWGGVRLKVTTGSKCVFLPTPGREILKSFPIHFCNIDIANWDRPRITEWDFTGCISETQF